MPPYGGALPSQAGANPQLPAPGPDPSGASGQQGGTNQPNNGSTVPGATPVNGGGTGGTGPEQNPTNPPLAPSGQAGSEAAPADGNEPPPGIVPPPITNPPPEPLPVGDFGLGGASLCGSSQLAICESFENAALGNAVPAGWTTDGYGNRTLSVVDDDSARGNRAFRVDVAANQEAVVGMLVRQNLGALGARHFGRSFMKIDAPAPTGFIHWDAFEARGIFNNQVNMVRWASTGTNVGTQNGNWAWIYNVQTTNSGEFTTEGARSAHPVDGDWMCLEWFFDQAAQEARFFYDGSEVDYLHIDTERAEIPVFTSFHVGFQKFQQSAAFRVWVDEIAFDGERIGCNR